MPKPRVYIETTIPNVYYEVRTEPGIRMRREVMRRWWTDAAEKYELITSSTVFLELAAGTSDRAAQRLDLLLGIQVVIPKADVAQIVYSYLRNKLMPAKPTNADATHLALAS